MIEQIIITSLAIIGLYFTTLEGMIFFFIRQAGDKHLPNFIAKPIYKCLTCMSGVYGLVAYSLWFGEVDLKVIPFVLAIAGINGIVDFYMTSTVANN